MRKFYLLFAIVLIQLLLFSCNSINSIKGGLTYRYIYKGTILYNYIDDYHRGDSVGIVNETVMLPIKEYMNEFWKFKDFWKLDYNNKLFYVDSKKTGWVNIVTEDSLAKWGKLIVKTLILSGENAGKEKVTMRVMVLDSNVNQPGVDYAPTISPDGKTLYFVSQRSGSMPDANGHPTHDFWAIKKENKYDSIFSKPYNIDTSSSKKFKKINTSANEGVASLAADGRTLYFTACGREDGVGDCDIYRAKTFEGKWSEPICLDRSVNSGYWDSQPSISPDGKTLYFTSNRPGPNGDNNFDIWYSVWDNDFDQWAPATNLSAINTKGSEVAPFIAADGVTLFFSSDGYDSSYGGLDFFITKWDDESKMWSAPAHLQQPLNTPFDDQFITLPASGDIVYFSSRREDIKGYQGDLDLYMAFVEAFFRAIVIKIYVAEDSGLNTLTYVTVDNPISKRKVKDQLTQKDNELSMVLTNADYGKIRDSVPYVDLNIRAENYKFGNKQKILRVKNPLLQQNRGGWIFNNELDETFEMSVSPELDNYLEKLKRTILDASVKISIPDKDPSPDSTVITIEEFQSSNTKPILPYVFFDLNSSEIPQKYNKFTKKQANMFSADSLFNLGTIDTYYHVLNIIGWRMKQYQNAVVNLTGCNSGDDENKSISEDRVNNVRKYLNEVWNIDTNRLPVIIRNLPENHSNGLTEEGKQENRRVECFSNDLRILQPIVTHEILKISNPEVINFKSFVSVKHGEATWELNATQDGDTVKRFYGEGSLSRDLPWNINDEKRNMPKTESPIKIELLVKDKQRDKIIVAKGELQVKQISTKLKSTVFLEDKRIDRFSLILFDFGKSKLNEGNMAIVNTIKDSIRTNTKVTINGYSDRIGNDSYNLKLSEKRAQETAKALGTKNVEINAIGEDEHIFNNDLPEGRFYCRTVQITLETPLNK